MAQDGPQDGPRWPQDGPEMRPKSEDETEMAQLSPLETKMTKNLRFSYVFANMTANLPGNGTESVGEMALIVEKM